MKNLGIALVVIVLVLVGMNQYESYKLNKTTNDGIEAIQNVVKASVNKEEELSKVAVTYASIRSAIATERQRKILNGDSSAITNLNNNGRIFSKILRYPVKDCSEDGLVSQCWEGSNSRYIYNTSYGESIIFELQNSKFKCVSNCIGVK